MTGLNSENPMNRSVAIFCVSNLANYLNPEIFTYHQAVLPQLIASLSDKNEKVIRQAVASIDLFAESLEESVIQYVPALLPELQKVVSANLSFDTIQIAISCYGSIAISMKEKMRPQFDHVIPLLIKIAELDVKGGNQAAVSEAMQSLGKISVNCMSLEEFERFIKPLIGKIY